MCGRGNHQACGWGTHYYLLASDRSPSLCDYRKSVRDGLHNEGMSKAIQLIASLLIERVDDLHPFYHGISSYRDLLLISNRALLRALQRSGKNRWSDIRQWIDVDGS